MSQILKSLTVGKKGCGEDLYAKHKKCAKKRKRNLAQKSNAFANENTAFRRDFNPKILMREFV